LDKKPLIVITLGDPAGIGPEIIAKAFSKGELGEYCRPIVIGDANCLRRISEISCPSLRIIPISDLESAKFRAGTIEIIDLDNVPETLCWGAASPEGGKASVDFIQHAADLALSGRADAIVTAPINKKSLQLAGYYWPGHTEMLAEYSKSTDVALMMLGRRLRVTLATLHIPLNEVAYQLTQEIVERSIRLTHGWLSRFSADSMNIAVTGLNPHCGDEGRFGDEERNVIFPAIEKVRSEGINADGPFPADSFFGRGLAYDYGAVVAMYHDQGLIPTKMDSEGEAVNLTLGIPILRTSVDHGTAYDIAGQNRAAPRSLLAALKTAAKFATTQIVTYEKT
tara:strand:- start:4785 stop:5798 length:1014 start_codon:yes stop_codon:yes gene_type:complete